ncbi:aquaporin TIP4-2-like [Vicia villosa]|uniref:aquaporin TIP4-2-like n=1 Tax=Vicia villosa TaxID=3911 RepID=UPI00273B22B2|nr:aquaporin TIP4-2-like [Vicia villosa]
MDPSHSRVVNINTDQLFSPSVGKKSPNFLSSIGAHEFLSIETWKAALTELIATALLMFTLISSIVACLDSSHNPQLIIPFVVFIIAFLFLNVTVPLTGGHMSPVFSFIAALKGVVTLSRALLYVLAQCIGSIIGFFILKCVMDPKLIDIYSLGGCALGDKEKNPNIIKPQDALLVEFSCTFLVLFVGLTCAFDKRRHKDLGLAKICMVVAGSLALAVFVSITVTGHAGYTGVGMNPARCLGPALLYGGSLWNGHWVFWAGPFLACLVYYSISTNLPKQSFDWVDGEYDVLRLTMGSRRTVSASAV